jgi:hypothetical protein
MKGIEIEISKAEGSTSPETCAIMETLVAMCRILGITPEQLVKESNDRKANKQFKAEVCDAFEKAYGEEDDVIAKKVEEIVDIIRSRSEKR